jgi:hypothetical protein
MNWRKPPEIVPRREKERDLFFSGRYSGDGMVTVYPSDIATGRVLWNKGRAMRWGARTPATDPVPPPTPPQPAKTAPDAPVSIWQTIARAFRMIVKGSWK